MDVRIAAGSSQADDVCAGRGDVGRPVGVASGRPVGGDETVGGRLQPTDGDDGRVPGRGVDAARRCAVVAGGGDDDDAGRPGARHRVVERGGGLGALFAGVDRDREHADVEAIGVRDHPVDAAHDLGDGDITVPVGDLDRDDARVGGDTEEIVGCGVARVGARRPAGDDAGEVRPVAVGVDVPRRCIGLLGAEVGSGDDPFGQRPDRRDAGVDDGDVDALAGDTDVPELAGADLVDHRGQRAERRLGRGVRRRAVVELDERRRTHGDHGDDGGDQHERGTGRDRAEIVVAPRRRPPDPTAAAFEPLCVGGRRSLPHPTSAGTANRSPNGVGPVVDGVTV